jgi:protein tyrosine phosphatase (PTP) superfamily phosphohydrolase (DUF442 family)
MTRSGEPMRMRLPMYASQGKGPRKGPGKGTAGSTLATVGLLLAGILFSVSVLVSRPGLSDEPGEPDRPARSPSSDHPRKLEDRPGIHNLLQVQDRIYSGSEPHGELGFANLARMGIRTIVSVDGARPDVETARKYGLRYVHVPIGYNEIGQQAGLALARVARQADGPLYVHCHHGRHRGPAAAAILCRAFGDGTTEEMTSEQALEILKLAGTGQQYAGLWRDVRNYAPPSADALLPELVEVAEVDSFPSAMAKLDRHFDNLKLCRQAGWKTPGEHPDLVPALEALLVLEGLRESGRLVGADRDDRFKAWLVETTALAETLERTLRGEAADAAKAAKAAEQPFQKLNDSCKQCHGRYRDNR